MRAPQSRAPWYIAGLVVLLGAGGWVAWSTAKKAEADKKAAAARIVPTEPLPAPDTTQVGTKPDSLGVTGGAAITPGGAAAAPMTLSANAQPTTATAPAPQVAPPPRAVGDSTWQRAVVTIAVNVREKPDRASKALLVLVPDDVVMLGESITGWRRVKVDGIDGWVDPRHFEIRPRKR